MALDAELINLKSAGTYRFERDLSEISNVTTSYTNLRLFAGFSKTGPFNTVKLVTSPAQFIKLYGNIDRSLEKKGSYFHRSCLVALSIGQPILCLNLLNLDPDADQVIQKSFSVNYAVSNKESITLPIQSIYNTDKFWYPSSESYLDALQTYFGGNCLAQPVQESKDTVEWQNGILNITNISKKPYSIMIKKASDYNSKSYNITLEEWYGEGNVPEYLNKTSFVSDYLVEVYVVGGDFGPALSKKSVTSTIDLDDDNIEDAGGDILSMYYTNDTMANPYERFSSDINYQGYFDERGFIRGKNDYNLSKFLNLPSVNLVAKYVGSLIPNFVDKLGRNIWIEKLINDDTDTIGLVCAENTELLEDVVEIELDDETYFIEEKIDILGHNLYNTIVKRRSEITDETDTENTIPETKFDFLSYKMDYKDKERKIKAISSEDGKEYVLVRDISSVWDADYELNEDEKNSGFQNRHPYAWKIEIDDTTTDEPKISTVFADATDFESTGYILYKDSSKNEIFGKVSEIVSEFKPLIVEFEYKNASDKEYYTSNKKDSTVYVKNTNEIIIDKTFDINIGDFIVAYYDKTLGYSRITRVKEIKKLYSDEGEGTLKNTAMLLVCTDVVGKSRGDEDNMLVKVHTIDEICDRLQWIYLPGFKIRKEGMPDGTNERQNMILDMLREEPWYTSTVSNLYKTLIDRDYVRWRYLVDTFGLGIEDESKKVYTELCQGRKAALAIVNCPSQLDFKKSKGTCFTNSIGGVEAEFIAKGGDLSKNPEILYSLPAIEHGASWGAYYYPYLKISDLSAVKTVPPAAYVSNLYITKYNRGFAWSIVAGQKRGVISGNQVIGVEATLVNDNRDWLEPAGINSIIWENGIGVEIYANKTAKHTPVSALSSAHVREAAIYIQDNVESILRQYVFEFNTAQTRLEIKTLVDDFLGNMKDNGGLYDFKSVMDTSNNTNEVIDHNMGIIDIYVEIVRGLEILAQRLTIMKTGAISTTGFSE